jgi:hypothetical protein
MKTIAALTMTLALAGISFAQTAAPAEKTGTATATTAKKSKKKVVKKNAAKTTAPAAASSTAVGK